MAIVPTPSVSLKIDRSIRTAAGICCGNFGRSYPTLCLATTSSQVILLDLPLPHSVQYHEQVQISKDQYQILNINQTIQSIACGPLIEPNDFNTTFNPSISTAGLRQKSSVSLQNASSGDAITGTLRDALVVATATCVFAYDPYDNRELFRQEITEGANSLAVGSAGTFKQPLVIVGGSGTVRGFASNGDDPLFALTPDDVNCIALCDSDGDAHNEIVAGCEDSVVHVFRNNESLISMTETSAVELVCQAGAGRFAYALRNGTIGVYTHHHRTWRAKAPWKIAALHAFDLLQQNDLQLVVCWTSGNVEIRSCDDGRVLAKADVEDGKVVSAVCSTTYKTKTVVEPRDDDAEDSGTKTRDTLSTTYKMLITCTADGIVRVYATESAPLEVRVNMLEIKDADGSSLPSSARPATARTRTADQPQNDAGKGAGAFDDDSQTTSEMQGNEQQQSEMFEEQNIMQIAAASAATPSFTNIESRLVELAQRREALANEIALIERRDRAAAIDEAISSQRNSYDLIMFTPLRPTDKEQKDSIFVPNNDDIAVKLTTVWQPVGPLRVEQVEPTASARFNTRKRQTAGDGSGAAAEDNLKALLLDHAKELDIANDGVASATALNGTKTIRHNGYIEVELVIASETYGISRVVLFSEEAFHMESLVYTCPNGGEPRQRVQVPLMTKKDCKCNVLARIHIRPLERRDDDNSAVLLKPSNESHLSGNAAGGVAERVLSVSFSIPPFAAYMYFARKEKYIVPSGLVSLTVNAPLSAVYEWLKTTFLLKYDLRGRYEFAFGPLRGTPTISSISDATEYAVSALVIRLQADDSNATSVEISHDSISLVAQFVKSLLVSLDIYDVAVASTASKGIGGVGSGLNMAANLPYVRAQFPTALEQIRNAFTSLVEIDATTKRMSVELAEHASTIKSLLLVCEEARLLNQWGRMKKSYGELIRLNGAIESMRTIRGQNNSRVMELLRQVNAVIEAASVMRAGKMQRTAVIEQCRLAVKNKQPDKLCTVVENGIAVSVGTHSA